MYQKLLQMPKHEKGAEQEGDDSSNPDKPEGTAEEQKGEPKETANGEGSGRNYNNLTDADRSEMKVDEIFALYLWWISKKVNAGFYQTVVKYGILFRECLNEIGWQKKYESEDNEGSTSGQKQPPEGRGEFCIENNAEHAPEICNEFVTVFMENKKNQVDISKPDQIDLTINLCHWLFENQFTCSKLSMIS